MRYFKSFFKIFIPSILAGALIGIGGIIFLASESSTIGAVLFSIGLYTILNFKFNLYTGKVGYLFEEKSTFVVNLIIIWIGNLIGAFTIGKIIQYTRTYPAIIAKANLICKLKIIDSIFSLFILGVLCGLLMYIAVESYKHSNNGITKFLVVALPVVVFIISGFEHSIADMVYITIANAWSCDVLGRILIITLGNSIGALIIPFTDRLYRKN